LTLVAVRSQSSAMPRKLRLEYPGAIYHVMSRGDQREDISFDDVDRHDVKGWGQG
jgi:hypothetical protein